MEENKRDTIVLKDYLGLIIIGASPLISRLLHVFVSLFSIGESDYTSFESYDSLIWFAAILTLGICIFIWGLIERFKEKLY
ncbi:MAG: hypothetical protein RR840_01010 [Clostridium sp.]